jgi:HD-GYP domain-containing protein (c-di-GMP phosphodiesterase class II)
MLKEIALQDVELGMFIERFKGSWFKHPFWRANFLLSDAETLQVLQSSNIDGVVINLAKGRDLAMAGDPAPAADRARQVSDQPSALTSGTGAARVRARQPLPAAPASKPAPPVDFRSTARATMAREFGKASAVADKSHKFVSKIFLESRLGKAINASALEPVVDDIFCSIQRNPHAFNGLMRCKQNSQFTYRHALAVCGLMISLGRQMKMSPDEIRVAGMAGLLMDVGVGHLPVDLASVDGDFRRLDSELLHQHPGLGYNFLMSTGQDVPAAVAVVCLQHHERFDGSGYPGGLAGEAISELSRMAAICAHYDWQVSDGADGNGLNPARAIEELTANDGKFDPAIARRFADMMGFYPIGSVVQLSSGRLAMVVDQADSHDTRPLVRTFFSVVTGKMIKPESIALSECLGQDSIVGVVDPENYGIQNLAFLRDRTFTNACDARG